SAWLAVATRSSMRKPGSFSLGSCCGRVLVPRWMMSASIVFGRSVKLGCPFAARWKLQEHILWRRVAGGLSRERQESILAPDIGKLRQQASPSPELVLLAGALERIGREAKTELVNLF